MQKNKTKLIFLFIIFFGIFGLVKSSQAVSIFYVAKGVCSSSCDGTTWAKAWDNFNNITWDSISAGDTIFVGTGTYAQMSIGVSGSEGSPVTIKKATAASHGSDAGWDATYATAAIITPGGIYATGKSWIVVDGQSSYGFIRQFQPKNVICAPKGIELVGSSHDITIRHVEVDGRENKEGGVGAYLLGANNINLQNVYIHGTTDDAIKFASGSASGHIIENSILGPRQNNRQTGCCSGNLDVCHGDLIEVVYGGTSSNIIFRNNYTTWDGDGIMFMGTNHDSWKIYNNIFDTFIGTTIKTNSSDPSIGNALIYNNTFYNSYNSYSIRSNKQNYTFHNNLYYLVSHASLNTGDNITAITNPFVNAANGNFGLKSTESTFIDQGTSLGSPYDADKGGVARPQGSAWDIGAYEYVSDADTTPPAAPSGLIIN